MMIFGETKNVDGYYEIKIENVANFSGQLEN